MTNNEDTPALDGLVAIIDDIKDIEIRGFHDYPDSISVSRLGTHSDSEFTNVWGDIVDLVWDQMEEIRRRMMPNESKYRPFDEPNLHVEALSNFNPSVSDDFLALNLYVARNGTESAALYEFNLKVAYYVDGPLRIQATISPKKGLDESFLNCTQEELTADMVEEAQADALDLLEEYNDLNTVHDESDRAS